MDLFNEKGGRMKASSTWPPGAACNAVISLEKVVFGLLLCLSGEYMVVFIVAGFPDKREDRLDRSLGNFTEDVTLGIYDQLGAGKSHHGLMVEIV